MRDILFRGKRVDNGEWVYGFYFREAGDFIKQLPSSVSTATHLVDPDTVGQFTGLTDKNGKKIFEGDLVRMYDCTDAFTVMFDDFVWQCKSNEHPYYGYRIEIDGHYEVIGNIYDNPELIN